MGFFDLGASDLLSAGVKIFGGLFGQSSAEKQAEANRQAQMDFAQHGVTWKAQDATAAEKQTGINRLALLGVPTNSFSNIVGSSSLGDSISSAGQDIGRAVAAATAQPSRQQQLEEKLLEARIANVNSDTVRNQAAASEIARKMAQPGTADMPKYITVIDRDGRKETILNPKIATSYQTPASFPAQVGTAIRDTYLGVRDALSDTAKGWAPAGFLSGTTTAERKASSSQYDPWLSVP